MVSRRSSRDISAGSPKVETAFARGARSVPIHLARMKGMDVAFMGVDGCRVGFIGVVFGVSPAQAQMIVAQNFADLAAVSDVATIAIDMPMGLPAHIGPAGRGPETALREFIGARRSSVFAMPPRAAIFAMDYLAACALARANSSPPRALSKQAFFLFPKIRELDESLQASSALRQRVFECHPEGSFCVMAGQPLAHPKKTKAGHDERVALLMQAGFTQPFLDTPMPRGVARDDLLDACAAAWTARRIAAGQARVFPQVPERDAYGIEIAIRA